VTSNPPFGKRLGGPETIGPLYGRMVLEYDRVMRPGGWAILLATNFDLLNRSAERVAWKPVRRLRVQVLGQWASLGVWRKAPV